MMCHFGFLYSGQHLSRNLLIKHKKLSRKGLNHEYSSVRLDA
jgi:hypothetical protein